MNPRITRVTTDETYRLHLAFENGEQGVYECEELLTFGVFKELANLDYFKKAYVLDGTVAWPNGQDICPDTLYLGAKKTNMVRNGAKTNTVSL